MNPIQMMQAIRNPQALLQQMASNSQVMNNPMARNAMQMMQNGDSDGLKKLAENICRERGTTPDEMKNRIMNQFGMN